MHTFSVNLFQLNYPVHVSNKCSSSGGHFCTCSI